MKATLAAVRASNLNAISYIDEEGALARAARADVSKPFGGVPLASLAIGQADVIVLVVDAVAGLTPADQEAAELLRVATAPVLVVANKAEGRGHEGALLEAFELGDKMEVVVPEDHDSPLAQPAGVSLPPWMLPGRSSVPVSRQLMPRMCPSPSPRTRLEMPCSVSSRSRNGAQLPKGKAPADGGGAWEALATRVFRRETGRERSGGRLTAAPEGGNAAFAQIPTGKVRRG